MSPGMSLSLVHLFAKMGSHWEASGLQPLQAGYHQEATFMGLASASGGPVRWLQFSAMKPWGGMGNGHGRGSQPPQLGQLLVSGN